MSSYIGVLNVSGNLGGLSFSSVLTETGTETIGISSTLTVGQVGTIAATGGSTHTVTLSEACNFTASDNCCMFWGTANARYNMNPTSVSSTAPYTVVFPDTDATAEGDAYPAVS